VNKKCKSCGKNVAASHNVYCSIKCQQTYQYRKYIDMWFLGEVSGGKSGGKYVSNYVRRWLFDKFDSKCQRCGWSEVNPASGLVPLDVHHIDGDSSNSAPSNVELLCPNCHSLTATYGNLNKGNGRSSKKNTGS